MRRVLALVAVLAAGTVSAQDATTLADIRQQMTVLNVEIQKLRRELSTTGAPQVATGASGLQGRISTIESELARLTGKTEELEFRINQVVTDGTRQLDDLNFRLCELEAGCDIGNLPALSLGAAVPEPALPAPEAPASPGQGQQLTQQLATNEQADFEAASAALEGGQYQSAAEQFLVFNQTYPGGPLAVAASLRRGEALESLGDTREAARAYLDAFRLEQQGPLASEALFLLGRALGRLGQTEEACVTLSEVSVRFPGTDAVPRAFDEMQQIGCS